MKVKKIIFCLSLVLLGSKMTVNGAIINSIQEKVAITNNIKINSQDKVEPTRGTIDDAIAGGLIRDYSGESFWNEPLYVGDKYPEDFGKSKYDKGVPNWRSLDNKTLNEFRAERRKEEVTHYAINIIIIVSLIALVLWLVSRANTNKNN
jgi:hypothetical protein